jgi:hypothetical protein
LQGGETFIYQYDWIGRATGVILSSGETLELTSKIASDEGLEITVSKPPTQLTVTGKANKKVIMIDGESLCVFLLRVSSESLQIPK